MDTLLKDLKHSLRMFWHSKTFTITAVAALALGIGANTAVFSIVNTVLLKPVPFPDPDRLVLFMNTSPQGSFPAASPAKFQHWKSQSTVQNGAAFRTGIVNLTGGEFPEQLRSAQVSADYFRLFGAPIIRGRSFSAQEDFPKGPKVALLSESLWTRRFGRDPDVLSKTISLSGDPHTIIGIIGSSFDISEFGPAPEVFVPFQLDPNTSDQGHYFQAAGRLGPGATLAQAKAQFQASAADYKTKFPQALGPQGGFTVEPFREAFVSNVREILLVFLGAVSFVLLIACANVANLLLVRATGRKREMAIRAAMGAGRWRLIRQLLTESVLLSFAGGALGLVLGMLGIRAMLSINTAGIPRVGEGGIMVRLDWRVAAFTLLVAFATGVLFGLIPAFQGSRADLNANLKETAGRSGTGLRQNKLRATLVVSEVALALILLVGSALLIFTQVAMTSVNPGFDATNVLTMRMSLTGPRFEKSTGVAQLVRDATERLRALPGVVNASATCCVPLEGGYGLPFRISGRPLPPAGGPFHGGGGWNTISPGYFDVFKMKIKRGRDFIEQDTGSSPAVVIINEAMARQYWVKGNDPLDSRLVIGRGIMREFADEPERQIIGIVSDIRDAGLNVDPQPRMYIPQAQTPDAANALNVRISPMAWVVRTQVKPQTMTARVQEELRQVTGLPVANIRAMDEVVSRSTSRGRFNMLLMTIFAGSALLLAAIGIYGLMAYVVEQRTQEMGIRLALGAEPARLKNSVFIQGLKLSLAGVALGVSFAFALTRFVASYLYEVKPWDPTVFAGVPLLLSAVALLAIWIPARRASHVNPMDALRYE